MIGEDKKMKQGSDIAIKFPGILLIHQKIKARLKGNHNHSEHEIFLPLQGEITIKTDEETLSAGPGKMIYVPPGIDHSFSSAGSNEGERLIFIIENKKWKELGGDIHNIKTAPVSQLCKEILFHLLINPKTKATSSLLQTFVITLNDMLEESREVDLKTFAHKSRDPRIAKALAFIEKQFRENSSMNELAMVSGMSSRTLNRLFITELSMTPKEVVTLFRMEEAKRLLKRKSLSVTDVSLEVGYQSLSQFITLFRKFTGVLPSDFK